MADRITLADALRANGYTDEDLAALPPGIAGAVPDETEGAVTLGVDGWRPS